MREESNAGRGIVAAIAVAMLAGCPGGPAAVRETIVRPHPAGTTQAPPQPTASGGQSGSSLLVPHGLQQSPEPFQPVRSSPSGGTGGAIGSGGSIQLGPLCKPTTAPSASPAYHFEGQKLFAGPFAMPPGPVAIHVSFDGDPTASFLMHLDTADQQEKNLVLEAKGKFDTTFSFPARSGQYAFYLQIDPLGSWAIDVYGSPASPSPGASASASPGSPTPSASAASAAPSASPSASPLPSPSPSPTDGGTGP